MDNSTSIRHRVLAGCIVGLLAMLALLLLESQFRPLAGEGLYFQRWSSETMMQTVSIEDLRNQPFRSLWYLHIQPPLYDGIRAVLAFLWSSDDSVSMLRHVDRSLYILWAFLYGMMGFVLFWWLSEITGNAVAFAASLLFLAHPACIFYATLLDTTFLSALLTLCFFYVLWRVKEKHDVAVTVLALSYLALFFTRSIYQWPWLFLLPLSLILMKYPVRKVAVFLCIAGLVVGLYTAKQLYLFDLMGNSFTGYNLCNSIGYHVNYSGYADQAERLQNPDPEKPGVLTRLRKVNGRINYNNEFFLTVNQDLLKKFKSMIFEAPLMYLIKTYGMNTLIYLYPSSQYTDHVIVDRLPQRSVYDRLFSFPVLPVLLILALLYWLKRADKSTLISAIGIFLPAAFIMFICIVFEQGENMRFKFFLEPVLFVFLFSQGYVAATQTIPNLLTRVSKAQGKNNIE